MGNRYGSIEARFWRHVQKTDTCWLWNGPLWATGYGRFYRRGEGTSTHRVSYELNVGPITDGLYVCHRCDVRACVNPAHLFLGTAMDNKRDSVTKHRHARGETNGNALLTQGQADDIRRLFAEGRDGRGRNHRGTYRQIDLAAMFNVRRATIANIVDNRNWVAA